ncbi:hypothetical protein ACXGQW_09680 [Wenyingzhuangia sp. IMCC45533]
MNTVKLILFSFLTLTLTNGYSQTSMEKAKKSFQWIDLNKDGNASMEEYLQYFKENRKDVKKVDPVVYFFSRDHNEDNLVSLEEFAQKPNWRRANERAKDFNGSLFQTKESSAELKEAENKKNEIFGLVDKDQNESISIKEYKAYAKKNGFKKKYKKLFSGLDKNSDKKLDASEFQDFDNIQIQ